MKKLLLLSLGFVIYLSGCGGNIDSITLGDSESIYMQIDEQRTLPVTIHKKNEDEPIEEVQWNWESEDESVAEVDAYGNIIAKSVGSTTVKVALEGTSFKEQVTIHVLPKHELSLTNSQLEFEKSEKIDVVLTPSVKEYTPKITWSSSNMSIVDITQDGVLTAKGVGTATIKASTDTEIQLSTTITVVPSYTFSESELDVTHHSSHTLSIVSNPNQEESPSVVWTSSNPDVATVDSLGIIQALSVGTAEITAKLKEVDKEVKSTVTVSPLLVTDVNINAGDGTVTRGSKSTLTYSLIPNKATNQEVQWTTSNPAVLKVDANGNIEALKVGSSTVTAVAENGTVTGSVVIQVKEPKATPTPTSQNKSTNKTSNHSSQLTVIHNSGSLSLQEGSTRYSFSPRIFYSYQPSGYTVMITGTSTDVDNRLGSLKMINNATFRAVFSENGKRQTLTGLTNSESYLSPSVEVFGKHPKVDVYIMFKGKEFHFTTTVQ